MKPKDGVVGELGTKDNKSTWQFGVLNFSSGCPRFCPPKTVQSHSFQERPSFKTGLCIPFARPAFFGPPWANEEEIQSELGANAAQFSIPQKWSISVGPILTKGCTFSYFGAVEGHRVHHGMLATGPTTCDESSPWDLHWWTATELAWIQEIDREPWFGASFLCDKHASTDWSRLSNAF